ncbi:MAG: hypothetical protein R3D27_09955 [Hyphomicrobiaceae bacterium]
MPNPVARVLSTELALSGRFDADLFPHVLQSQFAPPKRLAMCRRYLVFLILQLCSACLGAVAIAQSTEASGLRIRYDPDASTCNISLVGTIRAGDLDRIKKAVPLSGAVKAGPTVCLSVSGGDFVEGIKIARHVSSMAWSTHLQDGAICQSACSWIFLAGINASTAGTELSRTMHPTARLALHAPFIDVDKARRRLGASAPVERVVAFYGQAVAELGGQLLAFANHRLTTGVPILNPSLLAQALVKTGGDWLEVTTTGDAMKWDIEITGYPSPAPAASRDDVAMACRNALAKANEFWDWDEIYRIPIGDYEALYAADKRSLIAHISFGDRANSSYIRSASCELRFEFDDGGGISSLHAIANLPRSENVVTLDIGYDTRPKAELVLPTFAAMSPKTTLETLLDGGRRRQKPAALATLVSPKWCERQQRMVDRGRAPR